MLMFIDSWSSLDSQDSRYDAGDGRVGAHRDIIRGCIFLSFGVFLLLVSPLICLGGSNIKALRHQFGFS